MALGRRNPLPAGLAAGIVLVFLAGFAGVFSQWREAESARGRAERSQEKADRARTASEEVRAAAQAETYRHLFSEAKSLRAGHQLGWRETALADLARLAVMPTPRRDLSELRTEATADPGDARLPPCGQGRPSPADDLGSFAFSPDGRTLLTAGKSGLDFWDVRSNRHLSSAAGLTVT